MKRKTAILQSNYIPWKGYFDIINSVDKFIFYDDVQFTKNDWRNRNKIKTPNGVLWLTIPARQISLSQKIKDTTIANTNWNKKHWNSIKMNYSKSKYFLDYKDVFEDLYMNIKTTFLSEVNYLFISKICEILDIKTNFSWSTDYITTEGKTERLVDLCKQTNANVYISGPAAKDYIDESMLKSANIDVYYFDYSGYPEYSQMFGDFIHEVSILDLIFNEGPNSYKFMKSFKNNEFYLQT